MYGKHLPYWFTFRDRRQSPSFFLQPTCLRRLAGYSGSSGGGIAAERSWVFWRNSQQGSKAGNICCNGCSDGWEIEPVRFFLLAQKFGHHKQCIYSERWTYAAWTGKLLGTIKSFPDIQCLINNHPARSLIHSVLWNSNLLLGRDKGIKVQFFEPKGAIKMMFYLLSA